MNPRRPSYATFGQMILAFAAVVWGFLYARYALATVFHAYDDEGYFLLALTRYFRPGPLDPATYSNYGPFYYYAQEACFRLLGLPVTHDAGRWVTLFCWMASALLGGVFVFRISRSLLLGAAATLACFHVAEVLAYEPGHPQQVVLVLLTLASCLSVSAVFPRKGSSLLLLGAVGAALVFTKINVGAFYLAALAHALICVVPAGRLRSTGIASLLTYAVLAPSLLAQSRLFTGAGAYCAVASLCAGATFAWGALPSPDASLAPRRAWLAAIGAVSGGMLIVAATLWQGVTLGALIEGVLLLPARYPGRTWFVGFRLGFAWFAATAAVVAGISCLGWFRGQMAPFRLWLGALRCCVGLGAIFLLVRTDLAFVVAFLPLGVIPITRRAWQLSEWFPRLFIADLAATQFLQTYPMAGSQIGIASVPVMLWAFICLSDGFEELGGVARCPSRTWCNNAAGAFVMVVVAAVIWISGVRGTGYPYPPSRLRGAAGLHLPPQQAATYRFLAGSIAANCSVLASMPKLGSFNFWSDIPAPEGSYVTLSLESRERQKPILDQLQSDPRACVLYNRELLDLRQVAPQELARLPWAKYILFEMPKAAERAGYEIRINPHRSLPWVPYTESAAP